MWSLFERFVVALSIALNSIVMIGIILIVGGVL